MLCEGVGSFEKRPEIQRHSIVLVEPKDFEEVFEKSEIASYIVIAKRKGDSQNVGKALTETKELSGDLLADDHEQGEQG